MAFILSLTKLYGVLSFLMVCTKSKNGHININMSPTIIFVFTLIYIVNCDQVDGSIEAPSRIGEWTGCESGSWLDFQNVKGLTIKGAGLIDAKGSIWWRHKPQLLTNHTSVMQLISINILYSNT